MKMAKKEPEKPEKKGTLLRPEVKVFDERLLLPVTLVAHAFDVTMDAVIKWGIKPVVKKHREALLYLPEVIGNRMGFGEDGAPKLNPAQEKALLDRTRRERAEIELAKERGEIVSVGDVVADLEKELVTVRQRLLAIPNKLARQLVPMDKPQEIQDLLYNALLDALKDLNYGGRISFADQGVNSKDSSVSAEAHPS